MGTAPADTPWPGRTRPICAYPAQARYAGHGKLEDAANFVCVPMPDDDDRDHSHDGGGRDDDDDHGHDHGHDHDS